MAAQEVCVIVDRWQPVRFSVEYRVGPAQCQARSWSAGCLRHKHDADALRLACAARSTGWAGQGEPRVARWWSLAPHRAACGAHSTVWTDRASVCRADP
jgi:hypothetical protein